MARISIRQAMYSQEENDDFFMLKVHIKSVWEKNEESLLVVSYFPHFG